MASPTPSDKKTVELGAPVRFYNKAKDYLPAVLDFYEVTTTGEAECENLKSGTWKTKLRLTRLGNLVFVTLINGAVDATVFDTKPAFREGTILHRFVPKNQCRVIIPGITIEFGAMLPVQAVINNDGSIVFEGLDGETLSTQEIGHFICNPGITFSYQC